MSRQLPRGNENSHRFSADYPRIPLEPRERQTDSFIRFGWNSTAMRERGRSSSFLGLSSLDHFRNSWARCRGSRFHGVRSRWRKFQGPTTNWPRRIWSSLNPAPLHANYSREFRPFHVTNLPAASETITTSILFSVSLLSFSFSQKNGLLVSGERWCISLEIDQLEEIKWYFVKERNLQSDDTLVIWRF